MPRGARSRLATAAASQRSPFLRTRQVAAERRGTSRREARGRPLRLLGPTQASPQRVSKAAPGRSRLRDRLARLLTRGEVGSCPPVPTRHNTAALAAFKQVPAWFNPVWRCLESTVLFQVFGLPLLTERLLIQLNGNPIVFAIPQNYTCSRKC